MSMGKIAILDAFDVTNAAAMHVARIAAVFLGFPLDNAIGIQIFIKLSPVVFDTTLPVLDR